jgi:N-acetylglucosamine-6-phosphate deacetylase
MDDTLFLTGADIVLPDHVLEGGSLVVSGGRIVEVVHGAASGPAGYRVVDLQGTVLVPGFVDVHVHGVEGLDTLDGPHVVQELAARLPKYGVTAFSPTTVACSPGELRMVTAAIHRCRQAPVPGHARVLPAHLESNFISPDYKGAQPALCLRSPASALGMTGPIVAPDDGNEEASYTGADILAAIDEAGEDVGAVTMAPELDGGIELVARLVAAGITVSLGHSGASYEKGAEAIYAGARRATHLFNRMPPLGHREPGLVGAVLESAEVAAELVCDGYHVHPAVLRMAIAAKGVDRVMAVTDGSAGAGLPPGAAASLGGRPLTLTSKAAFLADGTLAGSTATMDRLFRVLVSVVGLSLSEAAILCATTPARHVGLVGHGLISPGAAADFVVLDRTLSVVDTCLGGRFALGRY